ncbi:leucine-rich repeat and IQ domain-containing protein 3 [Acipenser ruthenus]|uniref:leucine-rich repeat and IQ domain-containing protein 3 n=1 Tax=Acipenser ruthenus TaxID=7906 RepID=UPI0027426A51|nr:leucine-rich repeat and IQ domain-containing protein 3 [Acipenser ruthenus]
MNFMTSVPPLESSDILVSNSKSLILEHGRTANQEHRGNELQDIVMVKQTSLRLKNLNNIEYCRSLKICILANNYITKIEALSNCHELVKLDLHGNQITQLPGSYFWDGMKNLQFLNLHDNAIGNNIQFLSSCQSLIGLTLYDTPLSLRESYRHCIINSIWSLKALDNYVVSDEEIIEDWSLPQKFKAQTPNLFVDLCPVTKMESFTDEMKMVKDIISKINYTLAFYSPVLIIQRWIRGHLTRKRLGKVSWDPRPPQRSHVMEQARFKKNQTKSSTPTKQDLKYEFCIPSCGSEKNIAVDLEKLLQSDIVQAKESKKESYSLNSERNVKRNTPYCTPVQSHLFEDSKTKPKWNKGESDSEKYDLDELGFRLPGSKAFFHQADPVREMLISHRENGREIRFAIDQFHSASQDAAAKPKINYCPPVSMEKRLIARSYASISLTPFQVIEKAYRDRQKAENLNLKADWVAQARVTRIEAQNHIKGYLESRNSSALNKSERDSLQLQEAMEQHKTNDSKLIQLARQRHARFLEEKKQRAAENAHVKDFSAQHISISNAMLKYKMQERKYALRQEKTDLVMTCKLKQEERMQLVHKYMEHRKFAIQTEAHFEKMAIDSRLVQKANDRLKQVRAKVASQKAHRATLVAMQPVPVDQIPI